MASCITHKIPCRKPGSYSSFMETEARTELNHNPKAMSLTVMESDFASSEQTILLNEGDISRSKIFRWGGHGSW